MSFLPHPMIPQTPEQAMQRDNADGLATSITDSQPHIELARLRQAILDHRESVTDGSTMPDPSVSVSLEVAARQAIEAIERLMIPCRPIAPWNADAVDQGERAIAALRSALVAALLASEVDG